MTAAEALGLAIVLSNCEQVLSHRDVAIDVGEYGFLLPLDETKSSVGKREYSSRITDASGSSSMVPLLCQLSGHPNIAVQVCIMLKTQNKPVVYYTPPPDVEPTPSAKGGSRMRRSRRRRSV